MKEPPQSSFELRSTQDGKANFPNTTGNQESRNDIINNPSQISVEPAFSQDAINEVPRAAGNQESKNDSSKSTDDKTVVIPQEETDNHVASHASRTLANLSVRCRDLFPN